MKMLERRHAILDILQKEGSADINELAERLGVSSMTIRRDLKELAGGGSISILQGVAMLNDGVLCEYNMLVKHDIAVEEKRSIARRCLGFIQDGDSIFLDAGTTAKEFATLVRRSNKSITVLTHSLLAANELTGSRHASMIMCPGEYRDMSIAFMGPLADDFIRKFQIDTLFLTTEGVDLEGGVSVVDIADGHTKRVLMEQAKRVILMADSLKFGKSFFYKVAPIDEIDVIVTDANLNEDLYHAFQSVCKEIVLA